jgi:hypothetical protein
MKSVLSYVNVPLVCILAFVGVCAFICAWCHRVRMREDCKMLAYAKKVIMMLMWREKRLSAKQIIVMLKRQGECARCMDVVLACLNDLVHRDRYLAEQDAHYSLTERGLDWLAKEIGMDSIAPANSMFRSKKMNISGNQRRAV